MKIAHVPFYSLRFDLIRLFAFDDSIKLTHIRNERIIRSIKCNLPDTRPTPKPPESEQKTDYVTGGKGTIDTILTYLNNNPKIPVEIIISNKTMSCRSVPANLSNSDIKSMVASDLRSDSTNTVLYESNLFKKYGSIVSCKMQLPKQIIDSIKFILGIGNHFLGITCWPIWIISSYFIAFPEDKNKFSTSIFTIEMKCNWEIIVLHEDRYVCYRRGLNDQFDKNDEIANTIKHVSQICKIDPEDVVIYSINENTIASFTNRSESYMNILSDGIDFSSIKISQNLRRVINVSCILLLITLPLTMVSDIIDTFEISANIEESQKALNSVDRNVLNEIELWKRIGSSLHFKKHNFYSELQKYAECNDVKLLRQASLTVDESSDQITIDIVPESNASTE
ncbi:MAG: hypothetical protein LBJ92_03630 [Holosporales bacterium]|jgi:hypothetical protein|nr:hypothetical protein [Holosporales bacterium]